MTAISYFNTITMALQCTWSVACFFCASYAFSLDAADRAHWHSEAFRELNLVIDRDLLADHPALSSPLHERLLRDMIQILVEEGCEAKARQLSSQYANHLEPTFLTHTLAIQAANRGLYNEVIEQLRMLPNVELRWTAALECAEACRNAGDSSVATSILEWVQKHDRINISATGARELLNGLASQWISAKEYRYAVDVAQQADTASTAIMLLSSISEHLPPDAAHARRHAADLVKKRLSSIRENADNRLEIEVIAEVIGWAGDLDQAAMLLSDEHLSERFQAVILRLAAQHAAFGDSRSMNSCIQRLELSQHPRILLICAERFARNGHRDNALLAYDRAIALSRKMNSVRTEQFNRDASAVAAFLGRFHDARTFANESGSLRNGARVELIHRALDQSDEVIADAEIRGVLDGLGVSQIEMAIPPHEWFRFCEVLARKGETAKIEVWAARLTDFPVLHEAVLNGWLSGMISIGQLEGASRLCATWQPSATVGTHDRWLTQLALGYLSDADTDRGTALLARVSDPLVRLDAWKKSGRQLAASSSSTAAPASVIAARIMDRWERFAFLVGSCTRDGETGINDP